MRVTWVPALVSLIALIGSTSAAPIVLLDESRLVVFRVPDPHGQIAEMGVGANPGYRILPWESGDLYQRYKFPACAYWVPYFSLLSYQDAYGRIHVFPAVTRGSPLDIMGVADNVREYLSTATPIEVNLITGSPDPLELARTLGYEHLVLIVAEYDPLAISSALALKWSAVHDLLRREPGVPPEKVGVAVVLMARVTITDHTETRDMLIPLIPGAHVVNPASPFTWQGVESDPFFNLFRSADLIVVVYESKDEAFLNEARMVFGDSAIYVPASSEITAEAPAVVFNVPRGGSSWRTARMFEPWPSSLYLGALFGLPIAWMAEDLRLTGCRWEGVVLVPPPAEQAMYWDITTMLTTVLPTLLESTPHPFISYMTLTDRWNNSIQVGTLGFYGALPCLGYYPWDLIGVDLTTTTLLLSDLGFPLTTYNMVPEGEGKELGWGLVGPYLVIFEGPKGTPLVHTWYSLTKGFCEWVSQEHVPDQLMDTEMISVGLEGVFALAKAEVLGSVDEVLKNQDYRYTVFFGYPVPPERLSKAVKFDADAPNYHYTVVIGRVPGPEPECPFLLAQSDDVYAILALEPPRRYIGPDVGPRPVRRVTRVWLVPVPPLRSRRSSH
ncbi:hypothetical protein [Methanopyrus sp.]